MRRITIAVPDTVAERLDRVARAQLRDRKQQAAVLLVEGLERAELALREPKRRVDNE
jgi:hypothetical protein